MWSSVSCVQVMKFPGNILTLFHHEHEDGNIVVSALGSLTEGFGDQFADQMEIFGLVSFHSEARVHLLES